HGMRRISKRLVRSGALEGVSSAVPGMEDILVLGKMKSLEQNRAADPILIDAPAAGPATPVLISPRGLRGAVRVGPVSKQSTEVIEMLSDPARCQVILVTVPEETPVNEVVDTAFQLEDRIGVQLGPAVVNACYPDPGVPASVDEVQQLADELGVFVSPREAGDLVAAAEFRRERFALQQQQADRPAARRPPPQ